MQHRLSHERGTDAIRAIIPERLWSYSWKLAASRAAYIAFLTIALLLLLINLPTYPQPWFDEGYFLSIAKTLAQQGLYALPDSGGAWVMDQSIGSGPILIVPIALVFRMFGSGLLQGRLVVVVLGWLSIVAYALLARRLVGGAALGALLLLLVGTPEPFTSFLMMARQAIGEVSALGLCVYGIWLWFRAYDLGKPHWWRLVVAGLTMGIAIIAKPQMIICMPPALAIACLADRYYYRQASWLAFIIPAATMAACVATWYVAQIAISGIDTYRANSLVLKSGVNSTIFSWNITHIRHAFGTLWRSGFFIWGLPGLIYGCSLTRPRSRIGLANTWLLALVLVWLFWFLLLSVGWSRYGFLVIALTPIWSARLVFDLLPQLSKLGRITVVIALAASLLGNGRTTMVGIFGNQD